MRQDLLLQQTFSYDLDIPENLLQYVRVIVLGEHILNKVSNIFITYGQTYSGHEVDSAVVCYSFKKLGVKKYQIAINVGMYVSTDTPIQNNMVNLTYFISYINTQGNYELRKFKA